MGVISRKEQRKENKKQREWQSKENQLSRDHNLMLAELQNKWNKEQWDRENAYNSPSQQMQRFKDAGLNPNLIYGQTNTSAQLSGSLTAGQGYSPQDFSSSFDHGIADRAVSQGGNMIKSAAQLGDSLMQIPAYKEQVEGMRLANQEKRLDIVNKKTDTEFNQWFKTLDPYQNPDSPFGKSLAGRKAWMEFQNEMNDNDLKHVELTKREMEVLFSKDANQFLLKKLAAEAKCSEEEAKVITQKLAFQMGILQYDSELSNPEIFEGMKETGVTWLPTAGKLIMNIVRGFK